MISIAFAAVMPKQYFFVPTEIVIVEFVKVCAITMPNFLILIFQLLMRLLPYRGGKFVKKSDTKFPI